MNKNDIDITLGGDIIGLDLGRARTGVARMHTTARLPEPLALIDMKTDSYIDKVQARVDEHQAQAVVVGYPRGLDGQATEQTAWVDEQITLLRDKISVPVFVIDEAGTTKAAEDTAAAADSVDSVAAGIILEDFASEVQRGRIDHVSFA